MKPNYKAGTMLGSPNSLSLRQNWTAPDLPESRRGGSKAPAPTQEIQEYPRNIRLALKGAERTVCHCFILMHYVYYKPTEYIRTVKTWDIYYYYYYLSLLILLITMIIIMCKRCVCILFGENLFLNICWCLFLIRNRGYLWFCLCNIFVFKYSILF